MVIPIDLPEILANIGRFLDVDDLASCLCVNRVWHGTFKPLRWRDVRIVGIHSVKADVHLRRHAHLVRSLAFLHILSLKHFQSIDRYDRLERIHITKTDIDGRKVWDKLAVLVRQNRATLRIMILEDMMPLREFLMTLAEQENEGVDQMGSFLLQLRHLAWKRVAVYASSLGQFWKASQGAETLILECLTIKGIHYEGASNLSIPGSALLSHLFAPGVMLPSSLLSSPHQISSSSSLGIAPSSIAPGSASALATTMSSGSASGSYPHLPALSSSTSSSFSSTLATRKPSCKVQNLRISWIIDLPLDLQLSLWIQPCHELRSLIWEAFTFPDPFLLHFSRLLEFNTWPFLTSLEISSCVTQFPTDHSLALLLDAGASTSPSFSAKGDGGVGSAMRRQICFESLIFRNVDFGPLAFKSLRRHFDSLKTLLLIACAAKVTSAMAREVLESCPKLEYFQAPYLFVEDVMLPSKTVDTGELKKRNDCPKYEMEVESLDEQRTRVEEAISTSITSGASLFLQPPKPWVCLELRSLCISATTASYTSPPLTAEEEAVICQRLQLLKKLRHYFIGASISSAPS
ncbi:hypothetical protein BGX28_007419 [Mortierella sp. GBA30]|nr:hypothetical protein BGX28_007419 [Mortierella sp. GBA30]